MGAIRGSYEIYSIHFSVTCTLCLLFFLPRHTFSAVSFLAHVQHDISPYSIVVVGVWLVRRSESAGTPDWGTATLDTGLPQVMRTSCTARWPGPLIVAFLYLACTCWTWPYRCFAHHVSLLKLLEKSFLRSVAHAGVLGIFIEQIIRQKWRGTTP